MADLIKLIRLIREIRDEAGTCKRCGSCQAVCPVYAQTGLESDVARGKLTLLEGLEQEMFKNPKGVLKRLDRCLSCGSCVVNCPRNVNVLEIFIKSRVAIMDFTGLSMVKKIILRWGLSYPRRFDYFIKSVSLVQKLFMKPAGNKSGTFCVRQFFPFFRDRHFFPLANLQKYGKAEPLNPSSEQNRSIFSKTSAPYNHKKELKVAFFSGCVIRKLLPGIARASMDALIFNNVKVVSSDREGCCGFPAIMAGDRVTFNRLVQYNLAKFESLKFDYLVTSCATCTFAIKKIWPMMAKDSRINLERVVALAEKTIDINQFLVLKGELKEIKKEDKEPVIVTYHDPCHLKKSLGIAKEPRKVICANKNYILKEMENADRCCGFGGSFNLKNYSLSSRIGVEKQRDIRATGCGIVASGCPACIMQISDFVSKAQEEIIVKHPVEVYMS